MTFTEPTPTLPSERTPHPKKLSHEAAQRLHDTGELPDSEALHNASEYDPEKHVKNDEKRVKQKAEVYAIQAHLIAELAKVFLKGEGEDIRFAVPLAKANPSLEKFDKFAQELIYTSDSKEMTNAKTKVLEISENQAAFDRLKDLQGREELTGIL